MYTHTHTHFYRNAHTKVAVEWYRKLNQYAIPHLVCLTHGDRLYAECADEEQSERDVAYTKKAIKKQVEVCAYMFFFFYLLYTLPKYGYLFHYSYACNFTVLYVTCFC